MDTLLPGVVTPCTRVPNLDELHGLMTEVGDDEVVTVLEGYDTDGVIRLFYQGHLVKQVGTLVGQRYYTFGPGLGVNVLGCGSGILLTGKANHPSDPPQVQVLPANSWWEARFPDQVAFTFVIIGSGPQALPRNAIGALYMTYPGFLDEANTFDLKLAHPGRVR
jgi:hypothetical protein